MSLKRISNDVTEEMLFYDAIAADAESIWFIASQYNILVEIEQKTGIMSLCGFIPVHENMDPGIVPFRYRCLFLYNKKLFLFPHYEKDICVYDIATGKFEHIELDHKELKEYDAWQFTGYENIGNKVIVYGFHSLVMIMDLDTYEIKYLDLREKLKERSDREYWFLRYSYARGSKLFLVPLSDPRVIELDIQSGQVKCYELPEKGEVWIDNPVLIESTLYYFERKGSENVVLKTFDLESEKVETYDFGIKRTDEVKTFGFAAYYDDRLWMLPGMCGAGYGFDIKKKNIFKINDLPVVSMDELSDQFPYEFNYRNGVLTKDGHMIAVHAWSCQAVDIDMISGNIRITPVIKNESAKWEEIFDKLYDHFSGIDIKSEWMEGMLEAYVTRTTVIEKTGNAAGAKEIGDRIYRAVKNDG